MRIMLVYRSRFDHGFKPQNAVEAALSRVIKITAGPRAPSPHRLNTDAVRTPIDDPTGSPAATATCAHAPIPIVALESP
jgi:hypothetical protein